MILAFVCMGRKSADLYLEIKYIKAFSQEDLYEKHDSCQCLAHIETAMEKIMSGIESHIGDLQQGVSRSASQSSYSYQSRKRSDFSQGSSSNSDRRAAAKHP